MTAQAYLAAPPRLGRQARSNVTLAVPCHALIFIIAVELCDMAFQCELMEDPVVAADGHTYEATFRLP